MSATDHLGDQFVPSSTYGFVKAVRPRPVLEPEWWNKPSPVTSHQEVREILPHEMTFHTEQAKMRPDVEAFRSPEHDVDPYQQGAEGLPAVFNVEGHGAWVAQGHHRIAGAAQAKRPIKVHWTNLSGQFHTPNILLDD